MNIFKFLFYLGIINIVFGFVWKWVFVLPSALLFTFIKLDRGMLLVKAFGSYLLVSLTALITLAALKYHEGILIHIVFSFIGAFILFMGYVSNAYEAREQASMTYDYEQLQRLRDDSFFDSLIMFGAVALYVIELFVPAIAANSLTEWLYDVIDWAYNLPILGWLIGIGGVIFMLGIVWQGTLMLFVFAGTLISKFKGKTQDNI